MKIETPWETAERAMREKWSAERWVATIAVIFVGIIANALLRLL